MIAKSAPDARPRRLHSLRLHVVVALGTLLVLIAVNFVTSPQNPWWIYVLMGWMPLVAIHAAWAMELFRADTNRSDTEARRRR